MAAVRAAAAPAAAASSNDHMSRRCCQPSCAALHPFFRTVSLRKQVFTHWLHP